MTDRIAHGVVEIEVEDRDAIARLKALHREYSDTMKDIDRMRASATVDADIAPFEDAVNNVKREIRKYEGIKATAELDADAEAAEEKIDELRVKLKKLDGKKAEVELRVKSNDAEIKALEKRAEGLRKEYEGITKQQQAAAKEAQKAEKDRLAGINKQARAWAALNRQREQAAAKQERAAATSERERMAAVNRLARATSSRERQRLSELKSDHSEALRMERERVREMESAHSEAIRMDRERTKEIYHQNIGIREQERSVIALQRQYAKVTDRVEHLSKQRAFGREAKAKLDLDQRDAILQMEILKRKLNALGAHPPVDIKANVDEKGLARARTTIRNMGSVIGNKLGGLADATVRLGPFTTSVRGLAAALSVLGPTIFDVAGALGALVGVTGAGIAGAGAVGGGGLAGAAAGFLGLKFATRNTGQEIAQARKSINALQAATLKYGAASDKTKAKQDELNSVLKQISPLARNSAQGIERFFAAWDKLTKPTQGSLGNIAKGAFQSLDAITPMWARSTNKLAATLDHSLRGGFKFLRSGEFATDFQTITDNFNAMVPSILHGLGAVGRAFLNLSREGSRFLPNLGRGFDNLAKSILNFTQRDDFGATVKRWVGDAEDLLKFFGALTRVVVHFFGAGSTAGDDLLKTMTAALNRWDRFIQSAGGHNEIADFFHHSVDGAKELYNAIHPIIQLFALWAIGLEPAVKVITQIFAGVTNLASAVGNLVGLGNPLATFGETLGAIWAVSKIGAFVSTLSRIPGILKEIKAAQGGLGLLKELTSGRLFRRIADSGKLSMGGSIEAAGTAAAAEMRSAIISGGTVAAAEMRAASGTPHLPGNIPTGPVKTVEKGAEDLVKVTGAAAGVETAAGAAATAVEGITVATAGAAAAAGLLTVGLGYLGIKIATTDNAAEKWHNSLAKIGQSVDQNAANYDTLISSYGNVRQEINKSREAVKAADKALQATKPGTAAHKRALEDLKNAQNYATQAVTHWKDEVKGAQKVADKDVQVAKDQIKNYDSRQKARSADLRSHIEWLKSLRQTPGVIQEIKQSEFVLSKQEAARARMVAQLDHAQNQAAASGANMARVYKGMKPLVGDAEQALGRLARTAGKTITTKIAIKYTDPNKAAAVASAATTAVKSGVNKNVALKIVADSKNAEQAVRRLNALTLTPKKLSIIEHGGAAAVAMIEKITGKKLNPKQQKITEQGGPGVLAMLAAIIGRRLPDKSFSVRAQDYATSVIGRISGYLAGLHDKTVRVAVLSSGHAGSLATDKPSKGRASGGVGASSPVVDSVTARRQDRVFARSSTLARMSTGMLQAGRKITGPRAIFGEEPQYPEYVISTNPSYKKSNVRYLRMAAQSLGLGMHAGGHGFALHDRPGAPKDAGYYPTMFVPHKPKKLATGKRKSNIAGAGFGKGLKLLSNSPQAEYVKQLQIKEEDITNEIGLQQRALKEPDTFLKLIGQDENGENLYQLDQTAIDSYTKGLNGIAGWQKNLMDTITAEVTALPKALGELKHIRSASSGNMKQLDGEAKRLQKRIDAESKKDAKKKDQGKITMLRKRLAAVNGEIKREKKIHDGAVTDFSAFKERERHAGFDYRGAEQDYNDTVAESAAVSPNANQALADSNPKPATTGAGGSGTAADAPQNTGTMLEIARTALQTEFGSNVMGSFAQAVTTSPAQQRQLGNVVGAGVAAALSPAGAATAAAGAMGGGAGAASALSPVGGVSAPAGIAGAASGTAVASDGASVTITNNFAAPPDDSHTFSKQLAWDVRTAF